MKPVLLFLLTFSSFSLLSISLVQCATLPLQLMTLLSLKSSLKDPFSTLHDWDPSPIFSDQGFRRPIWCSWSGIKCNPKTNEVASLDLSHRNLSGVIPAEIRYLSSLLHLNLSGNSFDGPFQPSIFEIMGLRVIDISCNLFNSTFPTGISKLKSLRVFNAYSNSFVGPLPWEFIRLRFLEYLNLGGNYFEGVIPPGYGSFLGLRSLYLQGNLLGGPIPSQLGFVSSLEHLEIGYNEFHGGIPRELALLSNLIYLDMASSNLSSSLPDELGNLTKLETMLLFKNHFTGEIPPDFKNSQSIKYLDLSNNHITGEIPEWLASLKNLSVVNLMNNNLSGEIPAGIGELPNLEVLQLWNNSLTGILPQNLGSSAKLTKLDVSSNYLSGKIPPNLCRGNKLVKLLLFSNRFDHGLPPSLANCTSLNRLRVQDNMLNGSIPCGFGHLQNLTYVDMSRNNFSGKIPDDISNAVALQYLNLTGNSFQSNLPHNIWSAPNLQVFSASSSKLHGEIPDFIGCQSVYQIELGGNSLNGSIPWDIGHCEKLLSLNLTRNLLSGIIPWEISTLPSITDVDLSYNLLTGTIPSNFDNCSTLENFNVSFNLLTGPIPSSSTIFRNLHPSSFSGNQGLCGGVLEKPCAANIDGAGNMEVQRQPRRTTGAVVWITAAAFGMGLFVLIAGTKFVHAKYGHKADENQDIGPWKLTAFQRLNFTADDVVQCLSMTNTIIGMGSTGMVYRVEMPYGEIIAVKKLWGTQKEWQSRKRSGVLAEVDLLGNVRHRNIVRLLGCCSNKECTMLLYEYMPNGNLDEFLHGKNKSWSLVDAWLIRYKIALGVAQGICYLHHDCDPAIVHRDLKPSNILLDGEMEARVADFGVAKLVQGDESMSVIAGSYGYIAPEYAYTLQVDEKSDTYSYGVVLMEVLSGRKSVDAEFGEGNSIVDWVRLKIKTREGILDVLDKKAGASCESVREEMIQVLRIALLCTISTPADRPSMREVVMMLQEARPKRKFPGSINDGEEEDGNVIHRGLL